jgi:type II secretion system protein H
MNASPVRRRCGFTLVEILVVLIIIGIAAAIVVPQMSTRDDLKVAAAARTLAADLIYAQNLAITRQSSVRVNFDLPNARYRVVDAATGQTVTHPVNKSPYEMRFGAGGTLGLREAVLAEVVFLGADGETEHVDMGFDDLGTPMAYPASGPPEPLTGGRVRLRVGGQLLQVDVEPFTGQVRVGPPH